VEHVDVMFSEPLEEMEILRTFTSISSLTEVVLLSFQGITIVIGIPGFLLCARNLALNCWSTSTAMAECPTTCEQG
jgi:hypothetical protein